MPRINLFTPRCCECDRVKIVTGSGFLSCPRGHGKLEIDQDGPEIPEADTFLMFLDPIEV